MAKRTGMALAFTTGLLMYPALVQSDDQVGPASETQQLSLTQTVYVDASTSTWRSRGRVSFPLVPSLRRKLAAAGFTVVQKETDTHNLVLKVNYREERGKEIRFNQFVWYGDYLRGSPGTPAGWDNHGPDDQGIPPG